MGRGLDVLAVVLDVLLSPRANPDWSGLVCVVPFRGNGEEASSKNSKRKQKRLNRQKAITAQKKAAQAKPSKSAPSSSHATPAEAAQTKASKRDASGKKVKGEIKGETKGTITWVGQPIAICTCAVQ